LVSIVIEYIIISIANFFNTRLVLGAGRDDTEAAAIRTDFPIPQECGLYYYEVEIINKGVGG